MKKVRYLLYDKCVCEHEFINHSIFNGNPCIVPTCLCRFFKEKTDIDNSTEDKK